MGNNVSPMPDLKEITEAIRVQNGKISLGAQFQIEPIFCAHHSA